MSVIKRKIIFDNTNSLVQEFKSALLNWKKEYYKTNTNKLKKELKIDEIVKVDIEISDNLSDGDETMRLYVYKTGNCNIHSIKQNQFSHALQVSLGNDANRTNWVKAEDEFSAKVFPDNQDELIKLVEDIVLDIQMFYILGFDIEFNDIVSKRLFSRIKVGFLYGKKLYSYLGNIDNAEYVSFASFTRDKNGNLDFTQYINLWEKFADFISKNDELALVPGNADRGIITPTTISLLKRVHPKGGQLSIKAIEKKLRILQSGRYILIRTEKKPRNNSTLVTINNIFGSKKWKSGKVKIEPIQKRFMYLKLQPFVSVYEFDWKK